jgi:hypothetical protein
MNYVYVKNCQLLGKFVVYQNNIANDFKIKVPLKISIGINLFSINRRYKIITLTSGRVRNLPFLLVLCPLQF